MCYSHNGGLKQKHGTGTSSDRPAGEWQYRFHAPSPGDCGIEVNAAVVADSGNWTLVMADDQITVHTVYLDGTNYIL